MAGTVVDGTARERILAAAQDLFAEDGFDATPTSRIAERAGVPKGLVHYYFRRKSDLLVALIERLPDEPVERDRVVVPGDVAESLRRLVALLDARLNASSLVSHLLWREADTHHVVREALQARYRKLVRQIRSVILAARGGDPSADRAVDAADDSADSDDRAVDSAAELLASAVSYRHSVARHEGDDPDPSDNLDREVDFVARALATRR
ncbi:MAG TPA: helix-turn-helix domain-containing protein [Pseudonocardiaceae bacterium]|nr:helix-turn-helix domain-containing protein [Pseudonocardiaceae bacterium]